MMDRLGDLVFDMVTAMMDGDGRKVQEISARLDSYQFDTQWTIQQLQGRLDKLDGLEK